MQNRTFIIGIAATLLLCTACIKEEIYDTAHPQHGTITLLTDWSRIGSGLSVPESYTVQVDTYSASVSGRRNTIDNLFQPGSYQSVIFNTAERVTVKDAQATVATTSNDYIETMPGWLFSAVKDVVIERDHEYTVTATMVQQVRELNLAIRPTGGSAAQIATVSATLSGVAQQLDLRNGTLSRERSIQLAFVRQADGTYKATAHLLGIATDTPQLDVKVAFVGSTPQEVQQKYPLDQQLKTFNQNKQTPLTLEAQLIETPSPSGLHTTITDWVQVNAGSGTAD